MICLLLCLGASQVTRKLKIDERARTLIQIEVGNCVERSGVTGRFEPGGSLACYKVSNSAFHQIHIWGYVPLKGGAILINYYHGGLGLSTSTFTNISAWDGKYYSYGGAIYAGPCQVDMASVCADNCRATWGQFAMIDGPAHNSGRNFVKVSQGTIVNCGNGTGGHRDVSGGIYLGELGATKPMIESLNITNVLARAGGVAVDGASKSQNEWRTHFDMRYCNVMNGYGDNMVQCCYGFPKISWCNFINSTGIADEEGVIFSEHMSDASVLNCVFLENNGRELAVHGRGTFVVNDCVFDGALPSIVTGTRNIKNENAVAAVHSNWKSANCPMVEAPVTTVPPIPSVVQPTVGTSTSSSGGSGGGSGGGQSSAAEATSKTDGTGDGGGVEPAPPTKTSIINNGLAPGPTENRAKTDNTGLIIGLVIGLFLLLLITVLLVLFLLIRRKKREQQEDAQVFAQAIDPMDVIA